MKKLFFLTALLCANLMGWAAAPVTGSSTEKLDGNDFVNGYDYSFSTEGTTVTISFTEKENYVGLVAFLWDYTNGFAESGMTVNNHTATATLTNQVAGSTLTFACKFAYSGGMSVTKKFSYTVPEPDKFDPQLSLNETTKTLNAETSETFTIVPTRNGNGAISYSSNNTSVATVSNEGVVTAVSRGTATITVSVAATDAYYSANAELVVTVTGVNWNALSWIGNGSGESKYTDKFKVALPTSVGVVNIQNSFGDEAGIYLTFPCITDCDFGTGNYAIQGAGMLLYVSKFTLKYTDVVVSCNETDYLLTVFYADGEDIKTAITNTEVEAKAVKVIENGQLIIIKNGVKYNALGAELR